MKLEIKKVDNGYVLTNEYANCDDDEPALNFEYVFETEDNKEKLVEMLNFILDYFGEIPQKYERENVVVKIEHGRGYECDDKKCEICKGEL